MSLDALFQPLQLGRLTLPNRVIMAPLTRARATPGNVPTALMAQYYAQRADCGLIVSEATAIDPLGMGWYRVPGLWTSEMVEGWAQVTGAVHAAGGRIFAQLWHMGRLVLPDYIGGTQPLGPSEIAGEGQTFAPPPPDYQGGFLPMKAYVVPREMTHADIAHAVEAYGKGAANALQAGFDGVEIHAANGYLIDQFLQSNANHRTDAYGGDLAGRTRLLREVLEAVTAAAGPDRVGIRISPTSARKGMGDENPDALADAVAALAQTYCIAYIHLIEPIASGFMERPENPVVARIRAIFRGVVIQNGSFDGPAADACIAVGKADAVSFGRPYIANPDLAARMRAGHPMAAADMDYAYVGDARGYTDYPVFADAP
ncbi:MAG: alkene reductase [Novosphingobium sp.]|jgi:2,4-dienoyl-CoA reductase-like NADH-dependent reductase (Old Yellow Enzyme family)|uniref:alkene reductase n=1 Tax=Novosphingobium sp. TaxID=1874826 RepID=UPI0030180906